MGNTHLHLPVTFGLRPRSWCTLAKAGSHNVVSEVPKGDAVLYGGFLGFIVLNQRVNLAEEGCSPQGEAFPLKWDDPPPVAGVLRITDSNPVRHPLCGFAHEGVKRQIPFTQVVLSIRLLIGLGMLVCSNMLYSVVKISCGLPVCSISKQCTKRTVFSFQVFCGKRVHGVLLSIFCSKPSESCMRVVAAFLQRGESCLCLEARSIRLKDCTDIRTCDNTDLRLTMVDFLVWHEVPLFNFCQLGNTTTRRLSTTCRSSSI